MPAWHNRLPFDLVLILGDNIYGGFLGTGGGNRDDFPKKFDRPYSGLLSRGVVFRAALGNHDMSDNSGLDLVESYELFHIEDQRGFYGYSEGAFSEFFTFGCNRLLPFLTH